MKKAILLIFIHISICAPLIAAPKKSKKQSNIFDHIHTTLSDDILQVATRLDNFFGTERSDDEANNTRIRIYTVSTQLEGEQISSQGDIKLQLVLPRTQKRLRFILQSDDDKNEDSSAPKQSPAASLTQTEKTVVRNANDSTTAGLRYILEHSGIRTSFDSGLRFRGKVLLFARVRLRKNFNFGNWVFRPVEQMLWIQEQGNSSDTDLDFDRRLSKKWLFRFVNNIFWDDANYDILFTNGPSWFQSINEKIGLSYNFRIKSASTPFYVVNDYIASVGYRQLLYKKWFFWTITPALSFPRANSFHRTPSMTVRFDVILGSI